MLRTFLFVLLFLSLSYCGGDEFGELSPEMKSKIQKVSSQTGMEGVVLISQGKNLLLRESILGSNKGKPKELYRKHSFPLDETSKLFIAYAIHLLSSQGKVRETDFVSQHLTWFPFRKIQIQHLLRHTSGLPKVLEFLPNIDSERSQISRETVRKSFLASKLKPSFSPGEYWKFSRLDYILLGYIIEAVSKKTLQLFFASEIFSPLKLSQTYWDEKNPILGASGLYSNPEDLRAWSIEMQNPSLIRTNRVIFEKTILSDPIGQDPIAFGQGVYVGDYFFWSFGKEKGVSHFFYQDLKSKIFILIVCTRGFSKGDLSSIKSSITEILFEAKKLNLKKKTNKADEIYIEDLMAQEKVPSLGIAIFENYKLKWKKMYGTKSQKTLFRAGSLSKTVTAVSAMKLVETGDLDLHSNLFPILKKNKVKLQGQKRRTLLNLDLLLSHTAGLTEKGNWDGPENQGKRHLRDLKDVSSTDGNGLRLYYTPGTKSRYSGGGYSLVQEILTEKRNQSFSQLTKEIVFSPLGMERSTFNQNLTVDKDRCDGYDSDGTVLPQKIFVTPELSSGGLWTTPEEMGLLFAEVAKAKKGNSGFLTQDSAKFLLNPKMSAASLTVHALVAHGFFLNRTGRTEYFFHGGHTKGHKSLALFNSERGYGIVIMTNSENGSKLIWRILRAVSIAEKWDKFVN